MSGISRGLVRAALAAITALPMLVAGATPASAAGTFYVKVAVFANGGATADLSDTIIAGNEYFLTLTASGTGTCGPTGPTVQIADADTDGFGNPLHTETAGACDLYTAEVLYTASWVGFPGTSGQVPVLCTWTRGTTSCSPSTISVTSPL